METVYTLETKPTYKEQLEIGKSKADINMDFYKEDFLISSMRVMAKPNSEISLISWNLPEDNAKLFYWRHGVTTARSAGYLVRCLSTQNMARYCTGYSLMRAEQLNNRIVTESGNANCMVQ
jgi:hypothetical protein